MLQAIAVICCFGFGFFFPLLSSSYWEIMPGKQPAATRFNVCFHSGVFWGILIMPVITFNLQLNTYLTARELLIGSLKTEALNDMPFKCLICNYLLKCFPHEGTVCLWTRRPISPGSRSHSHTVHYTSLCLSFSPSSRNTEVLRDTE